MGGLDGVWLLLAHSCEQGEISRWKETSLSHPPCAPSLTKADLMSLLSYREVQKFVWNGKRGVIDE